VVRSSPIGGQRSFGIPNLARPSILTQRRCLVHRSMHLRVEARIAKPSKLTGSSTGT
jgi:hypothetical protein